MATGQHGTYRRLFVTAMALSLAVMAVACGGKGGGTSRPGKVKTIVGNVPAGYEASVAGNLAYWSSRWQVMQFALMSGAGNTTTIESNDMAWLAYLAEPSNGTDPATVPTNAAYMLAPYRYGSPMYATADNGQFLDFGDERWSGGEPSSANSTLMTAYLIIAEVEWARQFHYLTPFGTPDTAVQGSTERLTGHILAELAKRTAMYYINNRSSHTEDANARYKMVAALADLARLLREPAIGGTNTNRYRDVNFSAQIMAWMDFIFDELTDSSAPATADGLANAITSLGYYITTTLDESQRASATAMMRHYASALSEYETTDSFENACRIRGLLEAGRLLFENGYYTTAAAVFNVMKQSYVAATGVFSDRQSFTSYELSCIIGALNELRTYGTGYADTEWAELMMSDFLAASVYLSKLYRASYPIGVVSAFERPTDTLNYLFPDIPTAHTDAAPYAPHFASRIVWKADATGWQLDSTTFDGVGSLALAIELLWMRPNAFNPYPNYSGGISSPLRFGTGNYTFPVAMSEAYFTGRTAGLEFVLKSALGETFQLSPDVAAELVGAVSSPTLGDNAVFPTNMYLPRIPYNIGSPAWRVAYNGNANDYDNFRWTPSGTDKSETALAAMMLFEVRLARHLHDERHFGTPGVSNYGANERLKGMILARALKRQVEDLYNNSFNLPRTTAGRGLLLEALCEAAELFSADSHPGSQMNRYDDIDAFVKANELIDDTYEFLSTAGLPNTLEELRQLERGLFKYALCVPNDVRAREAKALVIAVAEAVLDITPADARDKADQFLIYYDAVRLNAGSEFPMEMRKTFVLLLNEYDPAYGYFSSHNRYTAADNATLMEALLSANYWGEPYVDAETSRNLMRGFIEGSYMLSGMVRSAPAPWEYPWYEVSKENIFYRYPTIQHPFYAGGSYGVAPVFAGEIEFMSFGSYWNMLDTLSNTYGLLYSADVLLRCNTDEFPQPEIPPYLK